MNTSTTGALAKIRAALRIKRLDPRRLYLVDDGAYHWIGDRGQLTAKTARQLIAIDRRGRRPDLYGRETTEEIDYDALCHAVGCIASSCGGHLVRMDDLPEDWRDGSSLGPISPL